MTETQIEYKTENQKRENGDSRNLQPMVLSQHPLIRAYLGDCMDWMQATADKAYDMAIVDPPYGIGMDGGTIGGGNLAAPKNYSIKNWDSKKPDSYYFDELQRVSKNQIIWGGNYYGLKGTSCYIVWDKDNGNNCFADCELAWTSFKTAVRKFTWKWQGMFQQNMANKEERIHPTQKPIALYRWLLKNYAKAEQRIFDSHGGSFSSAVACYIEGFDLDICEIDAEYFEAAVKRFKQATKQYNLFEKRLI